jgi:hypothetical protein
MMGAMSLRTRHQTLRGQPADPLLPAIRAGALFGEYELAHADAFEWLASAPRRSIHAVVTDPPYGLVEYQPHELAKRKNGRGGCVADSSVI